MKWRFPMNASKFHLILLSPEAKAASGRCSFRGRGRGSGKPHRGPGRRDEDSLGFSAPRCCDQVHPEEGGSYYLWVDT